MVERLFLAVPRGCLQFVIVAFPDHTHLLFLTLNRARLPNDHFRYQQSMFAFIDHVSTVYYWSQDGYAYANAA